MYARLSIVAFIIPTLRCTIRLSQIFLQSSLRQRPPDPFETFYD